MTILRLGSLGLVLLLGGCAILRFAPPPQVITSAPELIHRLKARQIPIETIEARGQITFLSPQRNYTGAARLKGRRPHHLRVDVRDPLGRSALSFYSDGLEVRVLVPQEGKLYRGPATPGNLAAFIPPPVTLEQAFRILTGDLLLLPEGSARLERLPSGQYRLELTSPQGGRQLLWVEPRFLNPVKMEWYGPAGQLLFTLEFEGYGSLPGGLPRKVRLYTERPQAELRFTYREVVLNRPLSEADLTLTTPPAVKEEALGP